MNGSKLREYAAGPCNASDQRPAHAESTVA